MSARAASSMPRAAAERCAWTASTAPTGATTTAARSASCTSATGVGSAPIGPATVPAGAASASGAGNEGDRKSVVEGKSGSVRVDLGGRRNIKKKNKENTNKTANRQITYNNTPDQQKECT